MHLFKSSLRGIQINCEPTTVVLIDVNPFNIVIESVNEGPVQESVGTAMICVHDRMMVCRRVVYDINYLHGDGMAVMGVFSFIGIHRTGIVIDAVCDKLNIFVEYAHHGYRSITIIESESLNVFTSSQRTVDSR